MATLTGENGILTRARSAKTQTEVAAVIESVRTDIFGKQAENEGRIKKGAFVEILKNYFDDVPTAEGLPEDLSTFTLITKAEYGSHTIKIAEIYSGILEEDFNFDERKAINADKYGWKVPEYTVITEEFTTGVWRLFYQDSNYTYLITDECVGSYKPGDYYSSYMSGADVSTVGKKLSPRISSLFTSNNYNDNIKATAWLTDTSETGMWSDYKNSDAVFAIGSPTIELFVASYNATGKSHKIELSLGTYGYIQNTVSGWLAVKDNYGIYNKGKASNFWLASPTKSKNNGYVINRQWREFR